MPPPSFEHRRALPVILRDVHHKAALAVLKRFGLVLEAWNPALVANFDRDDAITDAHNISLGDIEYEDTFHPADILGYSGFSLRWSGAPTRFLEDHAWEDGFSLTQHALVGIEAPLKAIRIALYEQHAAPPVDDATVFIAPEIPPVAVRISDLHAAAHSGESDDLRLIATIAENKGSAAVDYLSEDACRAIGEALMTAASWVSID